MDKEFINTLQDAIADMVAARVKLDLIQCGDTGGMLDDAIESAKETLRAHL